LSAHFGVASQHATRIAHNPYRTNIYRVPFSAPKVTFKTRIISKAINIKNRIRVVFTAWKKPAADRNIRRVVRKTSSFGARNKDDPHLEKRV
jgi:hypothetical protein